MPRLALLAPLLLLVPTLVAGCLTPPAEGAVAQPLDAADADTAAPWYVVDVAASPEATLTSFWWTVPEGAVYKEKIWREYDTTVLEVALVDEDGAQPVLTEWALYAFAETSTGLEAASGHHSTPTDGEAVSLLPLLTVTVADSEVETAPFYFSLGYDQFQEGDRVAFVFAARAESAVPLRVAFRVLPEALEWPYADDPSPSTERFLAKLAPAAPAVLPTVGTGDGLQMAFYVEYNAGAPFPFSARFSTEHAKVEHDLVADAAPFAGSGIRRISASFGGAGWSMATGFYWGELSVGSWQAGVDMHGDTATGGGAVVQTPMFVPTEILFGFPYFYKNSDGEGGSESVFEVDVTSVNAGFEVLVYAQVDLGETMDALFGVDAREDEYLFSGLVPGEAARLVPLPDGTLAHIAPGGFSMAWPSVGDTWPRA